MDLKRIVNQVCLDRRGRLELWSALVELIAPSYQNGKDYKRDPKTHSSKDGKQMYFGLKTHIGAYAESSLVQTVLRTSGKHKVLNRDIAAAAIVGKVNKFYAGLRPKVEHLFRVIKHQFGIVKVLYHVSKKNTGQLFTKFILFNLWLMRGSLLGKYE